MNTRLLIIGLMIMAFSQIWGDEITDVRVASVQSMLQSKDFAKQLSITAGQIPSLGESVPGLKNIIVSLPQAIGPVKELADGIEAKAKKLQLIDGVVRDGLIDISNGLDVLTTSDFEKKLIEQFNEKSQDIVKKIQTISEKQGSIKMGKINGGDLEAIKQGIRDALNDDASGIQEVMNMKVPEPPKRPGNKFIIRR